jgi:cell division protein FtsI/penicillin-binding protein 2
MAMTLYIAADHRAVGNKPGHAQDWPGLFIEIVGERFSPSGRLASVVAALITRIVRAVVAAVVRSVAGIIVS